MSEEEKEYRGKPLSHWKEKAEEYYEHVPISVLKYITVLEDIALEEEINVYQLLADKLKLVETDVANYWEDESGNSFYLTMFGFKPKF